VAAAFWVSPYSVAGSFGLGRHQGGAIVAVGLSFDSRGTASDSRARLEIPSLPRDVAARMVGDKGTAHDHGKAALCGAPEVIFDRPLGNHGRALARSPQFETNRAPLVVYAADAPAEITGDPRSTAVLGGAWTTRVNTCLDRIQNGYCDSVCGNCSYVLPSEAVQDTRAGDWSTPESLVSGGGPGACEEASYYGGPGQVSVPSFTGALLPDYFTHCARVGCSSDDEAPSMKSLVDSAANAPMSGRWGHNSNTDIEAEYIAFRACLDGQDGQAAACAVCGSGSSGVQRPCDDRTNTARTVWDRTASTLGGLLPLDKIPPITGDAPGETAPPVCSWGGFPVHGM
jgi:hypothetical protein